MQTRILPVTPFEQNCTLLWDEDSRIGAVVDYLDFHWQGWHWPAFNLADIFVVGGAGLLLLASALERTPQDAQTRVDTEQHPNKETRS